MKNESSIKTKKMSWSEFDVLMRQLLQSIELFTIQTGKEIDAIVPILRHGAIPGIIAATALQVENVLPLQVKYKSFANIPKQITPFVRPLDMECSELENILIIDSHTQSGQTANLALQIVQKTYAEATFHLATVTKTFTRHPLKLEGFANMFYGKLTNDLQLAQDSDIKEFDIENHQIIFPWQKAVMVRV